jgi:protein involved in polysaccharide export with SLBB domain
LLLENGDIVNVPVKDDLVLVGGEVLFPTTVAFQSGLSVAEYIQRAGGYTQNADVSRIIVAHRNGTFDEGEGGLFRKTQVRAGDSILVLPRIDVKWRQIAKDLAQILFQTALMTGVVLRLF